MSHHPHPDDSPIEAALRAALAERAAQIGPADRWEEIRMSTPTLSETRRRRWPVVLLAAAAVLAVVAGLWALRPQPAPTAPAAPSPSQSSPAATPSPSASPSSSTSEKADQVDPSGGALPVYYIAPEALGWPESGLGLRRVWVPVETPPGAEARAKHALDEAMARPTATEGALRPWQGVTATAVTVRTDRIDIVLDQAPTTDLADPVATLAVQELVWTAQAAVGRGNLPVSISIMVPGATKAWSVDLTRPFTRPAADQQYTVLTDLWITDPAAPEGSPVEATAGQALTVTGEASVFEATVQWELTDAAGTVVDHGVVMATVGAPGRGTFEVPLTIASAGDYTFKAFSMSMKDGQSEVANDRVQLSVR